MNSIFGNFKILASQKPELKILGQFKILAIQNTQFVDFGRFQDFRFHNR